MPSALVLDSRIRHANTDRRGARHHRPVDTVSQSTGRVRRSQARLIGDAVGNVPEFFRAFMLNEPIKFLQVISKLP